jgi:hypothetical protein
MGRSPRGKLHGTPGQAGQVGEAGAPALSLGLCYDTDSGGTAFQAFFCHGA